MCRTTCVIAVLLAGAALADEASNPVPEAVRPFLAVVERCEAYDRLTGNSGWRVAFETGFAAAKTQVASPNPQTTVAVDRVSTDGRDVLRVTAPRGQGMVDIDQQVSGDFAIEIVARTTSPSLCDISVLTNGWGQGPAFQFGGYNNQRNILWSDDRVNADQPFNPVDLEKAKRIERYRWHVVRMEVVGRQLRGYVDGELLGMARLTDEYDRARPLRPILYTYSSVIEVDSLTIERPIERKVDDLDRAWAEVFGQTDRATVRRQLADLGDLLDSDDYDSRVAAQRLLIRAGALGHEVVLRLAEHGSAEQRWRAVEIGRRTGAIQTPPEEEAGEPDPAGPPLFRRSDVILLD